MPYSTFDLDYREGGGGSEKVATEYCIRKQIEPFNIHLSNLKTVTLTIAYQYHKRICYSKEIGQLRTLKSVDYIDLC